tara:strand:- start:331 stop:582 length:252 start_codon:yes stop_codon:yes gene_type:complete
MNKEKWLNQRVMVDEWGRPPSLADVPLTIMTRTKMFKKRNMQKKEVNRIWNEMKKQGLNKIDFNNDLLFDRNKGIYYYKKEKE